MVSHLERDFKIESYLLCCGYIGSIQTPPHYPDSFGD